jgi:riboflavin kinase/FMN adenylyltransferase
VDRATALGAATAVVTFEPHPLTVLAPDKAPPRITTPQQKFDLLGHSGIDGIYVIRFDDEFARVTADEFVLRFLVERLATHEIYVGSGFVFGNSRQGDLALLEEFGARLGFRAIGVAEVEEGGRPISSTRIRRELLAGSVQEALGLLGRPHSITGTVSHGQGRGRGLGWPTINIEDYGQMLPASGVYTTTVRFGGAGPFHPSVTNVGRRPTFDSQRDPVVESHILDFGEEAYGLKAEVRFLHRLREERTFDGPDALSVQISRDVAAAREYFTGSSC